MISVSEAFENFSGNLEITPTESVQASKRQQRMREHLDDSTLDIADTFLTGAYRRATKTKPLADVDIMAVLDDRTYLDKHPHQSSRTYARSWRRSTARTASVVTGVPCASTSA